MKRRTPLFPILVATLAALGLAALAGATTPGQVSYQGLLLDDQGQPVTGNVDFVFTLYDADVSGSALWSESHAGVAVLDGVYDVVLGETTPITPAIVSGGALYLEIEVEGETLAPRQRLVAVPYALQAETAGNLSGFSGDYFVQMMQGYAFDGGDPPNDDPSEGLGDADGDGIANFLEPDNDDDGIPDVAELAQASDINLVTPTITGLSPEPVEASIVNTVTITGTSFEPGIGVVFGSQSPTAENVTSTSLEVQVGPQTAGTKSVVLTRANGESASHSYQMVNLQPTITSLAPAFMDATATQVVTLSGSGFVNGLSVAFGSENPTPASLTPTSFQVTVGPQPPGVVTVTVSYPSGLQATKPFSFIDTSSPKTVFATSTTYGADLGGIAGADAKCAARAAAGSLAGTFKAWIGDSTGGPATSFTQAFPYRLVDGTTQVAIGFFDLIDGSIAHAIDQNEFGAPVGTSKVWTNVSTDGTVGSWSCNDWSLADVSHWGNSGSTGSTSGWTDSGPLPQTCDVSDRLYCFEQ